jgi:ribosomal protein L25 (general stress protein Ctc)
MAKKARSRKRATFGQAKKALASAGVPAAEFGRHNRDGSIRIDHKKLEALQKRLGRTRQKHVRFVALNAPFKRRSPVSPA